MIVFMCDVKWVDSSRKKPPYRAAKFENLSYGLTIVTRMEWLKWLAVDIVVT